MSQSYKCCVVEKLGAAIVATWRPDCVRLAVCALGAIWTFAGLIAPANLPSPLSSHLPMTACPSFTCSCVRLAVVLIAPTNLPSPLSSHCNDGLPTVVHMDVLNANSLLPSEEIGADRASFSISSNPGMAFQLLAPLILIKMSARTRPD